jgi:hypothetical protein
MTTKELIKAEIDRLPEEALDEVYNLIKDFARSRSQVDQQTFMDKLLSIRIDAPEDFSTNLDDYLYGDKSDDTDLH